jgi:hypothetical protein
MPPSRRVFTFCFLLWRIGTLFAWSRRVSRVGPLCSAGCQLLCAYGCRVSQDGLPDELAEETGAGVRQTRVRAECRSLGAQCVPAPPRILNPGPNSGMPKTSTGKIGKTRANSTAMAFRLQDPKRPPPAARTASEAVDRGPRATGQLALAGLPSRRVDVPDFLRTCTLRPCTTPPDWRPGTTLLIEKAQGRKRRRRNHPRATTAPSLGFSPKSD